MGNKIITSLNEFIMTRPATEPTTTPSPTTRPEPPVKPLPPSKPDYDKIERPSIDTRPLAINKFRGKSLSPFEIKKIGKMQAKSLINRLKGLKISSLS